MDIKIKMLPEYHVAYVRKTGPYEPSSLAPAWEQLVEWAIPKGYMNKENTVIGISWDNPELCTPETCRYDAAITVPESETGDNDIKIGDLDEGLYAVCRTKVADEDFFGAWEKFFSAFLTQSSGYEIEERPCYEIYHNNAMEDPDKMWDVELCLPVKEK